MMEPSCTMPTSWGMTQDLIYPLRKFEVEFGRQYNPSLNFDLTLDLVAVGTQGTLSE